MGGFFAVVSSNNCVGELFYGTDYHSHLGTRRGGLAVWSDHGGIARFIHDITNAQFRSKFENDLSKLSGKSGIGVISDYEDQPLIVGSHLGTYAIVTVGKINNLNALVEKAFRKKSAHFIEMSGAEINPTELVATLINSESSFEEGIRHAQESIDGSCSMLILTDTGCVYAARDRLGRTPVILGRRDDAWAVTLETTAFPNLDFAYDRDLGPGEVVLLTPDGKCERRIAPGDVLQICAFLWVYYGYPSSSYEGINAELVRNRCGGFLAENDHVTVDIVAGIPDSGTGHAIGYAHRAQLPHCRPFVKYTPTWPRSFMPQDQSIRNTVAKMKLVPIRELIEGKRILFCEDSIVRGTQLRDTVRRLFDCGAREVHMRPACPPLIFGCPFLNFSRSKSEMDLAARRAIRKIEGDIPTIPDEYLNPDSDKHRRMVSIIHEELNLTTLSYQRLEHLIEAIGLPKEAVCTHCWDGASVPSCGRKCGSKPDIRHQG